MARQSFQPATETANEARLIGAVLKKHRQALKINMTAAAEAAGMSRITWNRLEKGEPTVAFGYWVAAAQVLGLHLRLIREDTSASSKTGASEQVLPLEIRLSDYPGLRHLAWHVGDRVQTLTPREALGIYARNIRHLNLESLDDRERGLMTALQIVFKEIIQGV